MAWDDAPPTAVELAKVAKPSWDSLPPTPAELQRAEPPTTPGLLSRAGSVALDAGKYVGKQALSLAGAAGEAIDRYTGAPMRAGISAAQSGENPIPAAYQQFGEDPSKAPTGKDIVKKAGVTDETHHLSDVVPGYAEPGQSQHWYQPEKKGFLDPTPAGAAGAAMDIAANPLNFIPTGTIANQSKALGRALAPVADAMDLKGLAGDAGKVLTKGGEALTGVPEKDIATYAKHGDEIEAMANASDNNAHVAANQMRENWANKVQDYKKGLADQISTALNDSDKTVSQNSILEALDKAKSKINPKLRGEELEGVEALKAKVNAVADENGNIPLKDAHDLKQYLQEVATPSYGPTGQIFNYGKQAAQAAKSGAAEVRGLINEAAPEVAEANSRYSQLHDIEDRVNRNMLIEGKPEASIISAGNNGNPANRENLKQLGLLVGHDMVGDAEKLSAMRTFADPKFLPMDTTGKSATRVGAGAGLGAAAGHYLGIGAIPGAAVGSMATSPAVLKGLINSAKAGSQKAQAALNNIERAGLLSGVARVTDKNVNH